MKINIFVSKLDHIGSAVSDDTIAIYEYFKLNNYDVHMFVDDSNFLPEICGIKLHKITHVVSDSSDVWLIVHSLYIQNFEYILNLKGHKILRYHNITPSIYFDDVYLKQIIQKGIAQTAKLKDIVSTVWSDSKYNSLELIKMGYTNILELPIVLSFKKLENNNKLVQNDQIIELLNKYNFNFLVSGRIVENKRCYEIAKFFDEISKKLNCNIALHYIGDSKSRQVYTNQILSLNNKSIYVHGIVSDRDYVTFFKNADTLLIYSDHEGFCVPILEAMNYSLPILAKDTTAIPYTLKNGGFLVNNQSDFIERMKYLVKLKMSDLNTFTKLKNISNKAFEVNYSSNIIYNKLQKLIENIGNKPVSIKISGPYDSNYSLAKVNRDLALAILNNWENSNVNMESREGNGVYLPNLNYVKSLSSDQKYLINSNVYNFPTDLEIRNMWPPSTEGRLSKYVFSNFAWEESLISSDLVLRLNKFDLVLASSLSTQKALLDSGVHIPIHILGNTITPNTDDYVYKFDRNFKDKQITFLHISSCFLRKSPDKLIQAFCNAFDANDNVRLIIKTFENPHNEIAKIIKEKNNKKLKIEVIWDEYDENQMNALYQKADVYISPSRGEGFNLPVAEAMLRNIPTIVTGWGGHMDFCDTTNSFLVDYVLTQSKAHVTVNGSMWAEPILENLVANMQNVYKRLIASDKELVKISSSGRDKLLSKYSPESLVNSLKNIYVNFDNLKKRKNYGVVTTWNKKCGIATYSKDLYGEFDLDKYRLFIFSDNSKSIIEDEINVIKCWDENNIDENNLSDVFHHCINQNLDILDIQFNFGFFKLDCVGNLAKNLHNKGIQLNVTLHSVNDTRNPLGEILSISQLIPYIEYIDNIYVFKDSEKEYIMTKNIPEDKIRVIPHGIKLPKHVDHNKLTQLREKLGLLNCKVISTHGFLLPHKGVEELIKVIYKLKQNKYNCKLLAITASHYNNEVSVQTLQKCNELISKYGLENEVYIVTDFLSDEEIFTALSISDVIVFNYLNTLESASGAIRKALQTDVPIIVNDSGIFDDIREYCISGSSELNSLSDKIIDVVYNRGNYKKIIEKRLKYQKLNNYSAIAQKIYENID